jgi:flagellar hook-basal body complex protein FliE
MRIEPLVPDRTVGAPAAPAAGSGFGALVDAAGAALDAADGAERAFAAGRGGLTEMVVERARADIALQIAVAGAQRVTQSAQTLLGMQI